MDRFEELHPDLDERVAAWRAGHLDSSLEDAVREMKLWRNPRDKDAQWFVWQALKRLGDPAALAGFQVMRAMRAKGQP